MWDETHSIRHFMFFPILMMCDLANDYYFERNLHVAFEISLKQAANYFCFFKTKTIVNIFFYYKTFQIHVSLVFCPN